MKKVPLMMAVGLSIVMMLSCGGATETGNEAVEAAHFELDVKEQYQPAEEAAQQVLLAYRTKDVDLLKEYAGNLMRMGLDESAMERPDYQNQINNWDGSIKEIRYDSDVITFEDVFYAYAYYMTDANQADILYVVSLESSDKENWVITMNPLRSMSRADFQEKSENLPG